MLESKKLHKNNITKRLNFLIPSTRITFNCLWPAFIKAPISQHFNLECHISIKINIFGSAIDDISSQLISKSSLNEVVIKADLSQWHSISFFCKKMIWSKTWYEIYNGELLAIIKALKTRRHY